MIQIKPSGTLRWVCADGELKEKAPQFLREIDTFNEGVDGNFLSDIFAIVGKDVVVC